MFVHADYLKYRAREKTRFAEMVEESRKEGAIEDPLIVFASVESTDEKSNGIAEEALAGIKDVANKVKARNIALFPFAHLSSDLASPTYAVSLLSDIEKRLRDEGYQVLRPPFGWYKVFEFRTKGHPLSLLSKSLPNHAKKPDSPGSK